MILWGKSLNIDPISVYLECPLEISLNRNLKRSSTIVATEKDRNIYGRYVPSHIIKLRWRTQTLPLISEGFKEVNIIHIGLQERNLDFEYVYNTFWDLYKSSNLVEDITKLHESGELAKLLPTLDRCWDMPQENKHHTLNLHMHMIKAAETLQKETFEMFIAGLLHDVGKFITKSKYGKTIINTGTFEENVKVQIKKIIDEKFVSIYKIDETGEYEQLVPITSLNIDNNHHFYEHDLIGAVIARRELKELGFDDYLSDKVYEYIKLHMLIPYENISKQTMTKLINKNGEQNVRLMLRKSRS